MAAGGVISMGELGRRLDRYAAALELDAAEFQGTMSVNIVREVAARTPIDTGKARSNWQTQVGSPPEAIRAPWRPYPSRWKGKGNPGGPFGETANVSGATRLATIAAKLRQPDQTVYLANNLPYIARLNQGYSKQAPGDFVRSGILAGRLAANREFKFRNMERV
jgi:hypothetical protein